MSHLLRSITIKNFRSIKDAQFELSNFTPLVGYNNAGKSNILSAIKWLISRSSLSEDYFYNKDNPIEISGIIEGINPDILDLLSPAHRKAIEPYIINGELSIKREQSSPGLSATKIKFYVKKIDDENSEWTLNPTGIDNAISSLFPEPIFIGAMENAEDDISRSRSTSTIGKLIAEIISPIEEKYGNDVRLALGRFDDLLSADGPERAEELNLFDAEMNKRIGDFFPGINVRLHIPTPQLKELFGRGTLKVYEANSSGRDVSSFGHGTQRSIQMALIRQLAEIKKDSSSSPTTTLLLIDEPELYLHPQAIELVREAFKILSSEGYQIIFSTHTALMIKSKDIHDAVLVRKTFEDGTFRKVKLREIINSCIRDKPSQVKTFFELSNSSNILFSDKVIITEGETENSIFPHIFELISKRSLAAHKYALLNIRGVDGVKNMMEVINIMGLDCKSIVDLDFISKAIKNNFLGSDDEDIKFCKSRFNTLSSEYDFKLSSDGWPCKGGSLLASEAFEVIGKCELSTDSIKRIHKKLLSKNIWLWRSGSFETHLGINGKGEESWNTYLHNLDTNGHTDTIADLKEVERCVKWLTSSS